MQKGRCRGEDRRREEMQDNRQKVQFRRKYDKGNEGQKREERKREKPIGCTEVHKIPTIP